MDTDEIGEKLGASRQMSLTQAVAYWKDRAEMAERRNLLNPEGSEYVAELEARLEELERERDEACEQVMQHQVSGDYEMGQYYHKELAMMPIINLRARLQRQRQQAVIEAAQVMVDNHRERKHWTARSIVELEAVARALATLTKEDRE